MAGAFVAAAGDEAEELGFELGHAAVEDRAAGFEQVGDGLGAGGLAGSGVDQADAQARVAKMLNRADFPQPAPPIETSVEVRTSPINRID